MRHIIQIIYIFLLFGILNTGCSGQTREQSKAKESTQTEAKGSLDTAAVTAQSNSILVTFIELGSVKCIPCKMMQPIMEEIEKEYAGQVEVVFHDVWTEQGRPYAGQYRIRVIPTQVFLDQNGNEYFRHEGYFPKEDLVKVLKRKGVH